MTKAELLNQPIGYLKLSERVSNCFKAARIRKVIDLVVMDRLDLLRMQNFGRACINEVEQALSKEGLHLNMTIDETGVLDAKSKDREVITLMNKCKFNLFHEYDDHHRSYEEGVIDTINWLVYHKQIPDLL